MGTRNGSNHADRASDLAGRLLQDIRLRGLNEGDRYLSTEEVGKAFRVRRATVNLAMRLLADRRVLVRTPGRGTYVGAEATDTVACQVHTLYMVIAADRPMPAPSTTTPLPCSAKSCRGGSALQLLAFASAGRLRAGTGARP